MFQSATVKLTGWYLLILMSISLLFSVTIYQITSHEISLRLEKFQNNLQIINGVAPGLGDIMRIKQADEASWQIVIGLAYANLLVLIVGGAGGYLLARRTLRPIEVAHEAQSRFTSDASHELRTPLASMKTELEVALRDNSSTKSELKDILRSNLEEVEKLSRLSEMLLNLSRLDHGKLERSAVDLASITRTTIKRFNQPASRVHIAATEKSPVYANQTAISELITILTDNALKYSPSGTQVTVSVSLRGRFADFTIQNSGPGIDKDTLPHIFDRFYRADKSRARRAKEGYGLGLSLAKKIVELHHGELTVTSEPHKATVFVVSLPLHQTRPSKK